MTRPILWAFFFLLTIKASIGDGSFLSDLQIKPRLQDALSKLKSSTKSVAERITLTPNEKYKNARAFEDETLSSIINEIGAELSSLEKTDKPKDKKKSGDKATASENKGKSTITSSAWLDEGFNVMTFEHFYGRYGGFPEDAVSNAKENDLPLNRKPKLGRDKIDVSKITTADDLSSVRKVEELELSPDSGLAARMSLIENFAGSINKMQGQSATNFESIKAKMRSIEGSAASLKSTIGQEWDDEVGSKLPPASDPSDNGANASPSPSFATSRLIGSLRAKHGESLQTLSKEYDALKTDMQREQAHARAIGDALAGLDGLKARVNGEEGMARSLGKSVLALAKEDADQDRDSTDSKWRCLSRISGATIEMKAPVLDVPWYEAVKGGGAGEAAGEAGHKCCRCNSKLAASLHKATKSVEQKWTDFASTNENYQKVRDSMRGGAAKVCGVVGPKLDSMAVMGANFRHKHFARDDDTGGSTSSKAPRAQLPPFCLVRSTGIIHGSSDDVVEEICSTYYNNKTRRWWGWNFFRGRKHLEGDGDSVKLIVKRYTIAPPPTADPAPGQTKAGKPVAAATAVKAKAERKDSQDKRSHDEEHKKFIEKAVAGMAADTVVSKRVEETIEEIKEKQEEIKEKKEEVKAKVEDKVKEIKPVGEEASTEEERKEKVKEEKKEKEEKEIKEEEETPKMEEEEQKKDHDHHHKKDDHKHHNDHHSGHSTKGEVEEEVKESALEAIEELLKETAKHVVEEVAESLVDEFALLSNDKILSPFNPFKPFSSDKPADQPHPSHSFFSLPLPSPFAFAQKKQPAGTGTVATVVAPVRAAEGKGEGDSGGTTGTPATDASVATTGAVEIVVWSFVDRRSDGGGDTGGLKSFHSSRFESALKAVGIDTRMVAGGAIIEPVKDDEHEHEHELELEHRSQGGKYLGKCRVTMVKHLDFSCPIQGPHYQPQPVLTASEKDPKAAKKGQQQQEEVEEQGSDSDSTRGAFCRGVHGLGRCVSVSAHNAMQGAFTFGEGLRMAGQMRAVQKGIHIKHRNEHSHSSYGYQAAATEGQHDEESGGDEGAAAALAALAAAADGRSGNEEGSGSGSGYSDAIEAVEVKVEEVELEFDEAIAAELHNFIDQEEAVFF